MEILLFLASLILILRVPATRCVLTMRLPCSIGGVRYDRSDQCTIYQGGYGTVECAVNTNNSQQYAIKFARIQNDGHLGSVTECEANITRIMHESRTPSTIKLYQSEKQLMSQHPEIYHLVMVTEYHRFGDVSSMIDKWKQDGNVMLTTWIRNRDEFVLKFIIDMASVLQAMWYNLGLIDRDFKLPNTMVHRSSNLTDPAQTTFVKIDYGIVITKEMARSILSSSQKTRFCYYGTNVRYV